MVKTRPKYKIPYSKEGDLCNLEYPNSGLRTSMTILEKQKKFIGFTYSDTIPLNRRIPDFRNTLYWNSEIKPGNDGKFSIEFYSSDFLSDYTVEIHGLTDTNQPLYYKSKFKVVK